MMMEFLQEEFNAKVQKINNRKVGFSDFRLTVFPTKKSPEKQYFCGLKL